MAPLNQKAAMKKISAILFLLLPLFAFSQDKVGINTTSPLYKMDIRSTDDDDDGPDLQLATPSENHFLRLFGGRGGDPRPFMLFSNADTFRIVTSGSDFSNFSEHFVMLPDGKVGFNSLLGHYQTIEERFQVFADQNYYVNELDQGSPQGADVFPINPTQYSGQIFTVGKTGFLTGFDVIVRSLGPGQAKLNYQVYENDENGALLDAGSVIVPNVVFGTVNFNTYPIPITVGDQLFLVLSYDSDAEAEWSYDNADPYAPGDGQFWEGAWGMPGGVDFAFTSYVDAEYANRLPILSVLDGEGRVKVNNYKLPAEDGLPQQVISTNGSGDLSWTTGQGGAFENASGIVRNKGNHATDDFVFGDDDLTSLFENKFFFDKDKGAFRAGRITNNNWQPADIGQFSLATGWNTLASGYASEAGGQSSQATGDYAKAFGLSSIASGSYALSVGNANTASGESAVSMGESNLATKLGAISMGSQNSALGLFSASIGRNNNAFGQSSFAFGEDCVTEGFASSTFGYQNIANSSSTSVVGIYNDPIELPGASMTSVTPMFIVGNGDGTGGQGEEGRSNALIVRKDGRVGIGTNLPDGHVHIKGEPSTDLIVESQYGDPILRLTNNGSSPNADWTMRMDVSDGDVLDFRSNGASKMTMKPDGTLAIGTSNYASGYLVNIGGKLIAEEMRVQVEGLWPDYVFHEDYDLPTLEQVEKSIRANHHLPGIPSAKEVAEKGLHLGEMQKAMMEKIEELTLYVIELNNKNNALEEKIATLIRNQKSNK